jgi:hypothetical protein
VLSEWDILEAISTAHLVKGRVEIIRKFDGMIKSRRPEKPDMQDYLKAYPWLINPQWTMLAHEQQLDTLVANQFGSRRAADSDGARRLDFFCLGDKYQTAHVVEAKRPNALVGKKEFDQLRDYVLFLRRKLQEESTDPEHRRTVVRGLMVADRIRPGDELHMQLMRDAFDVRTWNHLLHTTETLHEEFLRVVTVRAPRDDPRIQDDLPLSFSST